MASKYNDAEDRKRKCPAAGLRKISKRSDKQEIERLENNDARLIIRKKLNGTTI